MIQHQEYADFLAHYGVKGMKWGVRRRSKRVQAAENMYRKREADRVAQFKRDRSALYANAKKEWKTPGNGISNKVGIVGATALRRDLLNGDHVRAISRNKKLRRQEIRAARKADRKDRRDIRKLNRSIKKKDFNDLVKLDDKLTAKSIKEDRAYAKRRNDSVRKAKGLSKVSAFARGQKALMDQRERTFERDVLAEEKFAAKRKEARKKKIAARKRALYV